MLYNYNGETFKIENKNPIKLYHKAENKWSSGWTFIGTFKSTEQAKTSARKYAS